MFVDFVLNGRGHGEVGQAFAGVRFDPGFMRPFIETDPRAPAHMRGRPCATINTGRKIWNEKKNRWEEKHMTFLIRSLQERGMNSPVFNATTLTRDAWINIDTAVVEANLDRRTAWEDLKSIGTVSGFDAMAHMTHEYWASSQPGEAKQSMDAVADERGDVPLLLPTSVPLPITHGGFQFTSREIAVSKNTGRPLDTTMVKEISERNNEMIERQTIGTETGITYATRTATGIGGDPHRGTSTVYGYTNFPYRVTKTDLTTPTGTNPEAVMTDILEMIETMEGNGFYGPYSLYHSTSYSRYLNDDYFRSGSTSAVRTLRERIKEIGGITEIKRLDFLTSGYQLILVHRDPKVAQAIDGLGPTTIQWEEKGGLLLKFKVIQIQVPLMKAPYDGVSGILHGTTS